MAKYQITRDDDAPGWCRPPGVLLILCLSVAACTSDPYAPVNQTTPIRQMDRFFDSMTGPPAPRDYVHQPDYDRHPGYAPAYPTYSAY